MAKSAKQQAAGKKSKMAKGGSFISQDDPRKKKQSRWETKQKPGMLERLRRSSTAWDADIIMGNHLKGSKWTVKKNTKSPDGKYRTKYEAVVNYPGHTDPSSGFHWASPVGKEIGREVIKNETKRTLKGVLTGAPKVEKRMGGSIKKRK